jgi:hypothetical protein
VDGAVAACDDCTVIAIGDAAVATQRPSRWIVVPALHLDNRRQRMVARGRLHFPARKKKAALGAASRNNR